MFREFDRFISNDRVECRSFEVPFISSWWKRGERSMSLREWHLVCSREEGNEGWQLATCLRCASFRVLHGWTNGRHKSAGHGTSLSSSPRAEGIPLLLFSS